MHGGGQVVDGADLVRRQEEEGDLLHLYAGCFCQGERVGAALQAIAGDRFFDAVVGFEVIGLEVDDDEAVLFFEEQVDEALDDAVADGSGDRCFAPVA